MKHHTLNRLGALVAICIVATASADERIQAAAIIAERAGIEFDAGSATVSSQGTGSFLVRSGKVMVVSGKSGGNVLIQKEATVTPADVKPNHFSDDGQVFAAARQVLERFSTVGPYVQESSARWQSPATSVGTNQIAPIVTCGFYRMVNGYSARADYASVAFRLSDGEVLSVTIYGGWTYEPVDIRITDARAIELAIAEKGGTREEWRTRLFWGPVKPANTHLRLHYTVTCPSRGMMEVDAKTGATEWIGGPMGAGRNRNPSAEFNGGSAAATAPRPVDRPASKPTNSGTDSVHKDKESGPAPRYIIGAGAAIFFSMGVWYLRRQRSKAGV